MRNNIKIFIKITKILIVSLFFVIFNRAFGANVEIDPSSAMYHKGEIIKVNILLNTEQDEIVNAIEINATFPSSSIEFVGSEDADSIIGQWIEKPKADNGTIHFSGIIPGGFNGLIKPLLEDALNKKKGAGIIKLLFKAKEESIGYISISDSYIFLNNGLGTKISVEPVSFKFDIDNVSAPQVLTYDDSIPPLPFSISILQDELIFNNHPYIVFDTKDKQSGIDYYEVFEEGLDSIISESPYELRNNPPRGKIVVKAFDHAGNMTYAKYDTNHTYNNKIILKLILIFIIFILSVLFIKRYRVKS